MNGNKSFGFLSCFPLLCGVEFVKWGNLFGRFSCCLLYSGQTVRSEWGGGTCVWVRLLLLWEGE